MRHDFVKGLVLSDLDFVGMAKNTTRTVSSEASIIVREASALFERHFLVMPLDILLGGALHVADVYA